MQKPSLLSLFILFGLYNTSSFAQISDTIVCIKQIDSLIEISRALSKDKKFDEAYKIVEKAEAMSEQCVGKNHMTYANCIFNLGRVFHLQNKFSEALPYYQAARELRGKLAGKESNEYAAATNNTALVLRQLNRLNEAIPLYKEVSEIRLKKLGPDHIDYASALVNYGFTCFQASRYEEVEKAYLEVKRIREKVLGKQHQEYARILNNLAGFYEEVARYEEAEKYYLETKSIQETTIGKQTSDYAWTMNNMGLLYRNLGRYEEAEAYLLESIQIGSVIWGLENTTYASVLKNLAALYRTMGQFDQAEKLYKTSKEIQSKQAEGKSGLEYAEIINNLAGLYTEMDFRPEAEPLYLEAKEIFLAKAGKETTKYTSTLNNLAILYIHQNKFPQAKGLLDETKTIREKMLGVNHPDYANTLEDYSMLLEREHDLPKSLELKSRAVELYKKNFGSENYRYAVNLGDQARLEGLSGLTDKAQDHLIASSSIQRKVLYRSTRHLSERELTSYASLFITNNEINYNFANKLKAKPDLLADCYDNALFYKGFLLNAVSKIKNKALNNPETAAKIEILNSYQRRLITQYLLPINERDTLLIQDLEYKSNVAEKALTKLTSSFKDLTNPIRWQDVSKSLKPDEAAIEFVQFKINYPVPTDSSHYAALLLKNGNAAPEWIPLFYANEIEKLVGQNTDRKTDYVNSLYSSADRGTINIEEKKTSIFDLIWMPIEKRLQTINPLKTIYVSSTGLLHKINLAAIPLTEEQTMGEKYNIVMLNSTRQLSDKGEDVSYNTSSAAIFGGVKYDADSTFMVSAAARVPQSDIAMRSYSAFKITDPKQRGGTWNYLKWTDKEANSIETELKNGGFSIQLNKGYDATEESFKQLGKKEKSPRVIHIATHGYFFPDPRSITNPGTDLKTNLQTIRISENPMIRSGLILAGANYAWVNNKPVANGLEDGILTASEISLMNLSNTELVVLSACETGLGDIQGNEGVYGLQRAFKIAGVKYLIMSLWQVPDFQTQELMTTFYKKWLQDKMTIPEAFRETQKEMREKYQSPWFWAGFVLVE